MLATIRTFNTSMNTPSCIERGMSHWTCVSVWLYVSCHDVDSPVTRLVFDIAVKKEPRTIGTIIHTKPKLMIKARSDNPRKTRLDTT